MRKIIILVLLLFSTSSSQIRKSEEKTDFTPIFRMAVPAISTGIAYNICKYEDMDLIDQSMLLLLSLGISIIPSIIYEEFNRKDFKLTDTGQYAMGMTAGASAVMIWEF